ncbi:MAG TPA: sucrose phosphorylase [Sediminispirochaeta sp.]|nr:sucrose phosphorylase [Sediminispirochaeta sp.]
MPIKNACQLITYPDSLGGDLAGLRTVLKRHLGDKISGVHILPFYPSSGDRGFAPLTYKKVDLRFGNWEDIQAVAADYELMVDVMVNHISRRSEFFQDFVEKKDDSPWADLFIRFKNFWPGGEPSSDDLAKIYTRKPRPPYYEVNFADGSREKVWCTFDYEQIDLDLESPVARRLLQDFLQWLCERGAKIVRLDAFAYTTKKPGTSCFFLEPEVWEHLEFAAESIAPWDAVLLPEVHEHYSIQKRIAEHGYRVYDFALPMLVLQGIYDGTAVNLKRWLAICPRRQFTTLDTHDGIGVVDARDLMSDEEMERTKENVYSKGANVKRIYNSAAYQNLDIYQINCTYYSALGEDDRAYLLARAIQFFTPGIPQVYYVGLFAGRNDIQLVEETKLGRNINRHGYSLEEIDREMERPVVQRLLRLMDFRSHCRAFDGSYQVLPSPEQELRVRWNGGGETAELRADMKERSFRILHSSLGGELRELNLS